MTEDETVGWHHWLDGLEFEQAPGVGEGQGNLAGCMQWGHKEPDMSEPPNWSTVSYPVHTRNKHTFKYNYELVGGRRG